MSLRILYFAALREAVGCAREELPAAGLATVGDVIATLAARGGTWQALAQTRNLRAAVNQVMAVPATPVADGDEIAFFPPVTGG